MTENTEALRLRMVEPLDMDGDGLAQATLFVRHITAPDGQRTACVALFGADGLPVKPKVDWY